MIFVPSSVNVLGAKKDDDIFISVIISAFKRKDFLLDAYKSVLTQTLDKKNYEILVIKYFNDKNIDSFLLSNNAILINPEREEIGFGLAEAIRISRGEVIVFLDDDDTFMECKLSTIFNVFSKNKKIGYYHNNNIVIDYFGDTINSGLPFFSDLSKLDKIGSAVYKPSKNYRQLLKIERYAPDFNLSSISVRKDAIASNLHWLGQLEAAPDTFMYLSVMSSEYYLYLDSARLTKYRVHHRNTTVGLEAGGLIAYRKLYIYSLLKMRKMMTENKQSNTTLAKKILEFRILNAKLSLNITIIAPTRIISKDFLEYLKLFHDFVSLGYFKKALVVLICVLSPRLGNVIYFYAINRASKRFSDIW